MKYFDLCCSMCISANIETFTCNCPICLRSVLKCLAGAKKQISERTKYKYNNDIIVGVVHKQMVFTRALNVELGKKGLNKIFNLDSDFETG